MTDLHDPAAPPAAEDRPARRRPRAALVVAALLALAVGGGGLAWWLDARAEHAAAVAAATDDVRRDVGERYAAMATATQQSADASASLRLTLQEHLTVSERTDEELTRDREEQERALREAAERLRSHATAPPPDLPDLADEDALAGDLARLGDIGARAEQLADELVAAADASQRWAEALVALRAQADRYVVVVESQPETHDPDRLVDLWQEEREVLADYREAAEAAKQRPGLAPIADAYLAYIASNVRFIDDAVALLRDGDIEAYNSELKETFEGDDPFGFQAAVADATEPALDAGIVAELARLRSTATDLLVELRGAEATVVPSPGPDDA